VSTRTKTYQFTDFASDFQLEEKAKHCRDVEEERSAWEEKVRLLDRHRREMELRVKKTQNSVADHVAQLSKQV
jgi:hypothetical protein